MTSTLTVIDGGKGEPRVDSRVLATHLKNQHKAVMALIDRYTANFKGFGVLPFEMEKPIGTEGGRPIRFAMLNEDQAFFLLSLSRNTAHIVELKAKLVVAFREARNSQVTTAIEYLPGYHELHEIAHELAAGSDNERFVHMNLNKLVNRTVGIASGQRSKLPAPVRSLTATAQILAAKAMAGSKDHHDGYESAKHALARFGQLLVGRST